MKVSGAYNVILDYCMDKSIQNIFFFISQKDENSYRFGELFIAVISQIKYSVSTR